MKKIFLFLIHSIFFLFPVFSQQVNGIIYYQNSGGKPVINVQISAFGCGTVLSANNGMFILPCPGKMAGQKLRLLIGSTDSEGKNIEVVNARQLEWLRLPDHPDGDPIEIIVCYPGQRDKAALYYYGILEKFTNKEFERKLNNIQTQLQKNTISADERSTLIAQIDELKTERDAALEKLEEQTQFIASINQDQASELVKSAIQKIELEENIDAAITILDNAKLEEAYQLAMVKKLKAEKQIQQVIEGYELKISLLLPEFRYTEATYCYERIIEIQESHNLDKEDLALLFSKAADVVYDDGKYEKALEFQNKALTIREEILGPKHSDLAASYSKISYVYKSLGDYKQALEFQNKAIAIREAVLDPNHSDLAESYNIISIIYLNLGDYKQALEFQNKAIAIREAVLDPNHSDLAESYNNISLVYRDLGDYKQALEFQNKAIAIQEAVLDPNHPDLAVSYYNISLVYRDLRDYKQALEFQNKALIIREAILDPNHPKLANSYSLISTIYQGLGNYKQALEFQNKAIAIREAVLAPNHRRLAHSYNNIALIYQDLEDYEQALEFQNKAIVIFEAALDSNHPDLEFAYRVISSICRDLGQEDQVEKFRAKANAIRKNRDREDK